MVIAPFLAIEDSGKSGSVESDETICSDTKEERISEDEDNQSVSDKSESLSTMILVGMLHINCESI